MILWLIFLFYISSKQKFTRLIYQSWKSHQLPQNFLIYQKSWKDTHPTYTYILWDDHENLIFIKRYYPWFLPKYQSYDHNIKRADAVRYFFLYHFGGIYADLDFEALQSHEHLLKHYESSESQVILGKLPPSANVFQEANSIPNALMISKPRASFWKTVFKLLLENPYHKSPEVETGPILLRRALHVYPHKSEITILKPQVWYANGWEKPSPSSKSSPEVLARTYWTGTWK